MNAHTDAEPVQRSGAQYALRAGDYAATITGVGASVRILTQRSRDLVVPWDADEVMPLSRGAVIAPWPNRVGDGRWTYQGAELQLPLNEPERDNAMHGLISHLPFVAVDRGEDRIVLRTVLAASPGYPFTLEIDVAHRLHATGGLTTSLTARNLGGAPAPFGCCPHPYLVAGSSPLDAWTVDVPASQLLEVTPDRLLPTGLRELDPGETLDLRGGVVLGSRFVDHAFTGLDQGPVTVTVRDTAAGTGVQLRFDGRDLPWVQVHTADRPEPENHRVGLAVEPMTCPPDALRSGTDLRWIAPGDSTSATWRISGL